MARHADKAAPLPPVRSTIAGGFGIVAVWAGTFLLLWMAFRLAIADEIVCILVAALALVTLAPILGMLSEPKGGGGRPG
ncbi:hypothetical protein TS85_03920 [Sphingomonas hengshuiensis]|uniref:Uncharacterized protein n=1 Tax=Sphingomonas hengshuiensis TaxID=1609977 RepID=A0A7U4LEA0_9SPHN|nr:hypothetical protein TS85_03920 [Sphingomonas hengshuiensis]